MYVLSVVEELKLLPRLLCVKQADVTVGHDTETPFLDTDFCGATVWSPTLT